MDLAERKTGSAWAIQATPDAAGRGYNRLWSVSCPTAKSCFAVGDYVNKADVDVPLAEQWNGRTWSIKAVPHPAGTQITLMSVSCTTAKACTAVGFYDTRSARELPLVERWNGKAWKIGNVPAPAKTYGYYLQGVSCAAAAACTAGGGQQQAQPDLPARRAVERDKLEDPAGTPSGRFRRLPERLLHRAEHLYRDRLHVQVRGRPAVRGVGVARPGDRSVPPGRSLSPAR